MKVLRNTNLTQAERADPVRYGPDSVIVFHQNAKGHRKGDQLTMTGQPLPLDQAARFTVFESGELAVAEGEVIRITHNGKTLGGQRSTTARRIPWRDSLPRATFA